MGSKIATIPGAVDESVRAALLKAAEESKAAQRPTCRETFEPYRAQIQKALDSKVSLQKIFAIMQEHGVGENFSFGAFDRYLRESGYVKQRGKYAAFKGIAPTVKSSTSAKAALADASRQPRRQREEPDAPAAPRIAPDDL